ncbi:MAG: Rrf2 family transcriptional regulator [Ilumatobacteraceae bacterium]
MRIGEGVEWAAHCCTVLAVLPTGQALPAARLAEFHGVPAAYLAKTLQALSLAGIAQSLSGPRGGYRLARPAMQISLLDVVLAVDGADTAFRCTEIRRRGPSAVAAVSYRGPCGIARAMWKAEDAWRRELAATSISDLVEEMLASVPERQLARGATWIAHVEIERRSRS